MKIIKVLLITVIISSAFLGAKAQLPPPPPRPPLPHIHLGTPPPPPRPGRIVVHGRSRSHYYHHRRVVVRHD
jgi:hypothetical protein